MSGATLQLGLVTGHCGDTYAMHTTGSESTLAVVDPSVRRLSGNCSACSGKVVRTRIKSM